MFKETPDGQTHSYNDGCGCPEHNEPIESWEKEFDNKFIPKTFDSYQGWSIDELEEVREFITNILQSERTKLKEELSDKFKLKFNGFGGTLGFSLQDILDLINKI